MPEIFTGEHSLVTGVMVIVILGAFLTISLVMLWAPSRPFPGYKDTAEKPRADKPRADKPRADKSRADKPRPEQSPQKKAKAKKKR